MKDINDSSNEQADPFEVAPEATEKDQDFEIYFSGYVNNVEDLPTEEDKMKVL